MNCEKLHQDIEKLKEQYNSFSSKLKFSIEKAEGKGKIALSEQLRNTLALQDQILESYLPDFFEKNPELLQLNLPSSAPLPSSQTAVSWLGAAATAPSTTLK